MKKKILLKTLIPFTIVGISLGTALPLVSCSCNSDISNHTSISVTGKNGFFAAGNVNEQYTWTQSPNTKPITDAVYSLEEKTGAASKLTINQNGIITGTLATDDLGTFIVRVSSAEFNTHGDLGCDIDLSPKNMTGTNWVGYGGSGTLTCTPNVDGISVTITNNDNYTANNLVIPDTVYDENGTPYTVTTINNNAFIDCANLVGSLTIGNNVSSIGNYAFQGCTNLAFNLIIPNSVTFIGKYAFNNCPHLTGNLTIGSGLTTIGEHAFDGCKCAGSLIIPNNVVSISNYAFEYCSNFTSLILSSNITTIGAYVFYGCSSLIDDSGTIVENKISRDVNNVYYIFNGVFSYCLGSYLRVKSTGVNPSSTLNLLRNDTRMICANAFQSTFSGLSPFNDLTIPNSVTTICWGAFMSAGNIIGILTIPSSVTNTGGRAFYGLRINQIIANFDSQPTFSSNDFEGWQTTGTVTNNSSTSAYTSQQLRDYLVGSCSLPSGWQYN